MIFLKININVSLRKSGLLERALLQVRQENRLERQKLMTGTSASLESRTLLLNIWIEKISKIPFCISEQELRVNRIKGRLGGRALRRRVGQYYEH